MSIRPLKNEATQIICLAVAFFLAFSPIFHSLHLSSCHHTHKSKSTINLEHISEHENCCHFGSKNLHLVLMGSAGNQENHRHDPSTCPICQTFNQLLHASWFSLPLSLVAHFQAFISLPSLIVANTSTFTFPRPYPRAPPVF